MNTILLTGKPRSGKSYLVNEIVQVLRERELKVGGILTPDIRENNERTGFHIINIFTNAKEILASKHRKKGPTIGKYHINVKGINIITEMFLKHLKNYDVIVIDELGVMELKSAQFEAMLERVFAAKQPKLIVLNQHLVKFYSSYGELIEMKREDADTVKQSILDNIMEDEGNS